MPGYLAPGGRMLPRQALRKRFVGTWKPTMISGCWLWLDASDTSSITASSGAVSQWNDKSGNARHVTQSTAGNKPTTGTRTQNGRNVIDFDGGDTLASSAVTLAQPVTVFVVALSDTSASGNRQMVGNAASTSNPVVYMGDVAGEKWLIWCGTATVGTQAANTSAHTFSAVFNAASSGLWVDGTAAGTGNPGSTGWSADPIQIGSETTGPTSFWDGWIGEVIIYNSALGTTSRQQVETYLRGKWATS